MPVVASLIFRNVTVYLVSNFNFCMLNTFRHNIHLEIETHVSGSQCVSRLCVAEQGTSWSKENQSGARAAKASFLPIAGHIR